MSVIHCLMYHSYNSVYLASDFNCFSCCFHRVQAYIKHGWSSKVIDPDGKTKDPSAKVSSSLSLLHQTSENCSWQPLKDVFAGKQPCQALSFTNAQIINYFVLRKAVDGMPANDMKAINTSALNLFRCGHVQDIRVCFNKLLFIQAKCVPEMKKDRVYKLCLDLDITSFDTVNASCGCPAGRGPCASCKHVAALCYALEEFSRLGKLPDFVMCTEKLQEWNKPRPKKLEILPVADLTSRRQEILRKKGKENFPGHHDPQPQDCRKLGSEAVETLRCNLQSLSHPCAFLDILVPSVDKVIHDHTYSLQPSKSSMVTVSRQLEMSESSISSYPMNDELRALCVRAKEALNISQDERERIEVKTQHQSSQPEWHSERSKRITGSKCGKILCQKKEECLSC